MVMPRLVLAHNEMKQSKNNQTGTVIPVSQMDSSMCQSTFNLFHSSNSTDVETDMSPFLDADSPRWYDIDVI